MTSDSTAEGAALVAILRGVVPERILKIGDVLYAAGFRMIEIGRAHV